MKTIAVVGLGLMGGSLTAAIRRKMPHVRLIGISRNRRALASARKKQWIDEAVRDLAKGCQSADLVVLCTPVQTLPDYLKRIDRCAKPGTLVTDVGA